MKLLSETELGKIDPLVRGDFNDLELSALAFIAECFETDKDPLENYIFDMSTIHEQRNCGTAACIWGTMQLLTGPELKGAELRAAYHDILVEARSNARDLFEPWSRFGHRYSRLVYGYNDKKTAAAAIRGYLHHNAPTWSPSTKFAV